MFLLTLSSTLIQVNYSPSTKTFENVALIDGSIPRKDLFHLGEGVSRGIAAASARIITGCDTPMDLTTAPQSATL
jgi:hypothetical protein